MDTPYRVEPAAYNGTYRSHTFNIVTSRDGVLCSTPDQVFAHKLVDMLNAEVRRRADSAPQPS